MASITNRILDVMTTPDAENSVIDLGGVFSGEGLTYTIQSSDPNIAAVTLDGSQLSIDYLGALGYTDLQITATDANGESVTDNVRVRVAGPNAYTIAVLPDTQVYTYSGELDQTFNRMTEWLVANKDAHNINFVVGVGDITQNNIDVEWGIATEALYKLNGVIPYSVLPGNHDGFGSTSANGTEFNKYYSPAQQAAFNPDTFGGVYDQEPTSGANNYQTFTAPDGTKWLILSLEFVPRADVVRWAGDVIEDHLDHRVILSTHFYMNWSGRADATSGALYDEAGGTDARTDLSRSDGEIVYRELVAKYPNVTFTFSGHVYGDGAETLVSYNQFGEPVYQMLANYQDGGAKEISGNGETAPGGRGGQGAIRLITIDPDNDTMWTETYFANFDEYMTGSRGSDEPDRDGLTGPYRDQEDTIEGVDFGTPSLYAMAKANADMVVAAESGEADAEVTLNAAGSLNPNGEELTFVWTDAGGHVVATGEAPTVTLAAGNHNLTLTATDSQGRTTTDDLKIVVTNSQTLLVDDFNDGNGNGWTTGSRIGVKNSSHVAAASDIFGEDMLADYSDSANRVLVWTDPAALAWSDYVFESTLVASDNDGIGAVFYYQNASNYYRVAFDGETNTRTLVKIQGGVQTVLATVHGGTPFQQEMTLKIAVHDGVINVFLDGHDVFGTVVDANPLGGGTVGFYSNNQRISMFDDVAVNGVSLTAHAGDDQRAFDFDGDGKVTVSLGAEGTYGLADVVSYVWTDAEGNVVATGKDATAEVDTGHHELTLTVTDTAGKTSTDHVMVEGVAQSRILVAEDFGSAASLANWTIVDEGEFGGVGPDGTSSQWELQDGKFVQLTDLASRQLVFVDASPTDVYDYLVPAGFWTIMLNLQKGTKPAQSVLPVDWATATPESIWSALTVYIDTIAAQNAWDPAMTAEIQAYLGEFFATRAQAYTWPAAADGAAWTGLFEWISPVTWQSVWEGPENYWERGWSPLGDGASILRKGTYALYNDPAAKEWSNYAVETKIQTPDNGALGVLVYYQDPNNYYKIELDANGDFDRTYQNGTGALFQLIQIVDGIEKYLIQIPAKYTPGEAFDLRVEVLDGKIQVFVNGEEIFAYAIEDHAQTKGTVGLFSWGSAGVSFDNVVIYDLRPEVTGTEDDDVLEGSEGADLITALGGDDVVAAGLGDDEVDGGAGNDMLDGGAGNDVLAGGEGDDVLDGGAGADKLDGGAGDDVLLGGEGDDELDGGEGDDVLAGDAGADDLDGGEGKDELDGGEGSDVLAAGEGDDTVAGGAGDDELDGGEGDDSLDGGEDDDTLKGDLGADILMGAAGADELDGGEGDDELDGGEGNDELTGGEGDDDLTGGAGADVFLVHEAAFGKDTITDFASGDVIEFDRALFGDFEDVLDHATQVGGNVVITEDGVNTLTLTGITLDQLSADSFAFVGEAVDQALNGGSGNDVLEGGAGDDTINGGYGNDTLGGRAGDDVIDGGYGNDAVDGGSGNDTLKGGYGNDAVDGGAGNDALDGGYGNDAMVGGAGVDSLIGGYGDDALAGDAGNDVLDGGYGNDSLAGGEGDDAMTGGRGNDTFAFAAGFGKDRITDFGDYGNDVIEFAAGTFASYAEVMSHAAQLGADVVITFDGDNSLTLVGTKLAALHDDDFRFV